MPLRLHAIMMSETPHGANGHGPESGTTGAQPRAMGVTAAFRLSGSFGADPAVQTSLIPFRDLSAVVSEQKAFSLDERTAEAIALHRTVVDTVFRRAAVLPAPVGVVFRAPDVLKRWMELHYVSLTDALEFVEERAVARVHVVRADGMDEELEAGSDLAAAATEALRALRRRAVASVPLRTEAVTGLPLSSAFLVENEQWKEFHHGVAEQQDAHPSLHFDVTGPWAPYDFIHMQFGG
jgi:Gas vesicle synthesis protein GvpL/GvpF